MLTNPFGRTPIELLDDMCHMESRFNLFVDIVSLGGRLVHRLRIMYHMLRNHYGSTPMIILGEEAQVEGRFDLFGDSANLDAR